MTDANARAAGATRAALPLTRPAAERPDPSHQGDTVSELAVARLEKRYKSRTVVHDVSLSVASGEVVGLLGPNGAGKTTCFYMIVGLVPADGGRIELDGRNLSRMPIHARARMGLSYLPQEASRRSACPAASADASRSPARWPRARASSCSTSRSRASIRSR